MLIFMPSKFYLGQTNKQKNQTRNKQSTQKQEIGKKMLSPSIKIWFKIYTWLGHYENLKQSAQILIGKSLHKTSLHVQLFGKNSCSSHWQTEGFRHLLHIKVYQESLLYSFWAPCFRNWVKMWIKKKAERENSATCLHTSEWETNTGILTVVFYSGRISFRSFLKTHGCPWKLKWHLSTISESLKLFLQIVQLKVSAFPINL